MSNRARPPLVLLQTSDWHVGSPLTGRGLRLPAELRAARREEVDGAAERAVAAARGANADALLVPGDLWDAENVPPSSIHRVLEALASFAPKPVLVAPGNHDFAGPGGWYDPGVLLALGMRAWPENVLVFRSPDWTALTLPGREDAAVVGRSFLSPAVAEARPLAPPPPRPDVPLPILLLHGSLESYSGPDAPSGPKRMAPFSREELLSAGFTWAALGHHHTFQLVEDDAGVPRAAYSGCPTGRGADETGPRRFLKVTLAVRRAPVVEAISADRRTVLDLALDVSDLDGEALVQAAVARLEAAGAGPLDFVRLTLAGALPYGARPAQALVPLASRVAHLLVRDRTASPLPASPPDLKTAEGRFFADLAARREAAPEGERRRVIDAALAIGRDALAGRPLAPREPEGT